MLGSSHGRSHRRPAWPEGQEDRRLRRRLAGLEPRREDARRGCRAARGLPRSLSPDRGPRRARGGVRRGRPARDRRGPRRGRIDRLLGHLVRAVLLEPAQIPEDELERKLTLLEAAWRYFDGVAARVSLELERGPRGGGRNRDQIVRHVIGNERSDLARKVGVLSADDSLTPEGLRSHREAFVAAMRDHNAEGRNARGRNWTIALLLRHTAYHVLDHAWEMEDKDLS